MNDLFNLLFNGFKPTTPIDRSTIGGYTISTVDTCDCGPETAIIDANGSHPVERYNSIEEAREGHLKWVAFIGEEVILKGNKTITKLGYGSSLPDKEIELT